MMMASSISSPLLILLSLLLPLLNATPSASTTQLTHQTFNNLSSLQSFCNSKPYPNTCFNSLKLTISININPNILTLLLQTLQNAITESTKLTNLITSAHLNNNIIETHKGTIQDCTELHQITDSYLKKSLTKIQTQNAQNLADARAYLSAVVTNKNTCLQGLNTASGRLKPTLIETVITTYKHVSNSLSMIPKEANGLISDPKGGRQFHHKQNEPWLLSRKDVQSSEEYDPNNVLIVAVDGSGNFTTITDAINFAPNMSYDRILIYVVEGVYNEYVDIPSYKTNIVLIGDGSDATVITGNRSMGDNWTTFRSATVAVSGEGFLARDIKFENTAGPEKKQAVALRVNADLAAFYRCTITGFQDTLYVHSFRQFYRECDIYGTIDYIFGNAAVVIQASNIVSQLPLANQFVVITAQSRETAEEDTGISIQNCSILATEDLYSNSDSVKTYLGRPWRPFSRAVYLESYMDDFLDPNGWSKWNQTDVDDEVGLLDTLYYGEYENYGPGSGTENRVTWSGYHVMEYYEAYNFSVSVFITGDEWLESTAFPYEDGI